MADRISVSGDVEAHGDECAIGILDSRFNLSGVFYPPDFPPRIYKIDRLHIQEGGWTGNLPRKIGEVDMTYTFEGFTCAIARKLSEYLVDCGVDMREYPLIIIGKTLPSWTLYSYGKFKMYYMGGANNPTVKDILKERRIKKIAGLDPNIIKVVTKSDIEHYYRNSYGELGARYNL